jgi:hypothetical protein
VDSAFGGGRALGSLRSEKLLPRALSAGRGDDHFNFTCAVSGLPIGGGDEVRVLLLQSSPYSRAGNHADGELVWYLRRSRSAALTATTAARTGSTRATMKKLERHHHDKRNWSSGQFIKSAACDGCGKPVGTNYFTDDEVCGGGDGPGFYLCERKRCAARREGMSVDERRALYERTRAATGGD